jgi:hypothetical protein
MYSDISQFALSKLQSKTLFKITHLVSLLVTLLLSSAVFNPLIACTFCADSITLSYFPGLDFLPSIIFIYILGRCISSLIGIRKMSWKWNGIIFVLFFILSINFGHLNALMVVTVYFIIKHTWQVFNLDRSFQIGDKIDLTLLLILVIALYEVYNISTNI